MVGGGDVIGIVYENGLFKQHKIMVPPRVSGTILHKKGAGKYKVRDVVMTLKNEDNEDKPHEIRLSHFWPVRAPRPCAETLAGTVPLLTG